MDQGNVVKIEAGVATSSCLSFSWQNKIKASWGFIGKYMISKNCIVYNTEIIFSGQDYGGILQRTFKFKNTLVKCIYE